MDMFLSHHNDRLTNNKTHVNKFYDLIRASWGKRASDAKKPNERAKDNSELPPYETNGSVMPVMGNIPIFIPTLIAT